MSPESFGAASSEGFASEKIVGEGTRVSFKIKLVANCTSPPMSCIRTCHPITSPRDTAPLLTWSGACVGALGMLNSRNGSKHQHTPHPTTTLSQTKLYRHIPTSTFLLSDTMAVCSSHPKDREALELTRNRHRRIHRSPPQSLSRLLLMYVPAYTIIKEWSNIVQ
jgi:hypothetical protein